MKEVAIRVIRSACFAIVFGFVVMALSGPIMMEYPGSDLLFYPEYIGGIAGVLLFFSLVLVPLPIKNRKSALVIRSLFLTILFSYLYFTAGKQYDPPLHPGNIVLIGAPLLFIGLLLTSWDSKKRK